MVLVAIVAASAIMVASAQDESANSGDLLAPSDTNNSTSGNATITPDPAATQVPDAGNVSAPTEDNTTLVAPPTPVPETAADATVTPAPTPIAQMGQQQPIITPGTPITIPYTWDGRLITPTPSAAPATAANHTDNNVTADTPTALPCPTPAPTPLASDASREHTGTSLLSTAAMLLGLVSAGFLVCIGYLLIRK